MSNFVQKKVNSKPAELNRINLKSKTVVLENYQFSQQDVFEGC